jgi:hypothetical protein
LKKLDKDAVMKANPFPGAWTYPDHKAFLRSEPAFHVFLETYISKLFLETYISKPGLQPPQLVRAFALQTPNTIPGDPEPGRSAPPNPPPEFQPTKTQTRKRDILKRVFRH